jgi:hypothetical protein
MPLFFRRRTLLRDSLRAIGCLPLLDLLVRMGNARPVRAICGLHRKEFTPRRLKQGPRQYGAIAAELAFMTPLATFAEREFLAREIFHTSSKKGLWISD